MGSSLEETLKHLQRRSPFEAALQKSPFEMATVQAHVARVVSESSAGRDQFQMLCKDGAKLLGKHHLPPHGGAQRSVPAPSPFDQPPPNIGSSSPTDNAPKHHFDWQLIAQMGSSMEDVLSFVTRRSSVSVGVSDGLPGVPSS